MYFLLSPSQPHKHTDQRSSLPDVTFSCNAWCTDASAVRLQTTLLLLFIFSRETKAHLNRFILLLLQRWKPFGGDSYCLFFSLISGLLLSVQRKPLKHVSSNLMYLYFDWLLYLLTVTYCLEYYTQFKRNRSLIFLICFCTFQNVLLVCWKVLMFVTAQRGWTTSRMCFLFIH